MPDGKQAIDEALLRLHAEWDTFQSHSRKTVLQAYVYGRGAKERLQAACDRDPDGTRVLDEACRAWARGQPWPSMNQTDAYLVYCRIEQGLAFGVWLKDKVGFPGKSVEQILDFLVVEHWAKFGRVLWWSQIKPLLDREPLF
jgi:hypothetical protein